jgi:ABC-type sulfate transport system permease component
MNSLSLTIIIAAVVGFITYVIGFAMGLLLVEHLTWCGP